MTTKKISVPSALKIAFAQYVPHSWLFLKCMLLEMGASLLSLVIPLVVLAFLRHQISNYSFIIAAVIAGILVFVFMQAIMGYASAGFTQMALKLHEGKVISFKDFFVSWKQFKRYFIIYTIQNTILLPLYGAGLVFIGYYFKHITIHYALLIIAFLIPAIIYALILYTRYFFATYVTLDKHVSVKESFAISAQITGKSMKSTFSVIFWTQLFSLILSQFTLGLASFALIPVLTILYAYIYKPVKN